LIIVIGEAMRRAQLRAGERGEILRVTLNSIGDAVITTDVQGRVMYLNAVAETVTGWSNADARGRALDEVFNIISEETREKVESPASRALRDGVVVGLANHTILIRKNGEECPVDDSAAPIRSEQGQVSGCVLIFRDVSEKRSLEIQNAKRLVAARLLAAIVRSSEDAIISKSLDGTIQTWNSAAERLFGYTADEAIGKNITMLLPTDRLLEEDEIIANLKAGRRIEHFETERRRSDGQLVPVSLTISPIVDDDGNVSGASKIVRDITARKLADDEREKFVTLIENSTDFIGLCDPDGIPFFVNRAGLKMVGLEDVEAARKVNLSEFFFPEDRDMIVNDFLPKVVEAGHGEVDVRFRNFKTGEPRWMAYKVVVLKDAAGNTVGFATVSQDMTERRRMEDDLRKLADDLSEADRRKNEFLAMLAHELRNPLAPISNAVSLLRTNRDPSDPSMAFAASEMLQRQVGQMTRLVDDLLDMSRITQGKIELRNERVELAPIINQAVEAVRPLYSNMNRELTVSLPVAPIYVNSDSARLAQVIGNLLNNACKFTETGGRVAVSLETVGDDAVVRVRDNGIGIAAEEIPHLFDLFAQVDTSLERSQGGLGIGLTLAKKLIEMSGGSIEALSEGLGKGSEFVIRLPLDTSAERAMSAASAKRTTSADGGYRVLIVDDNIDGAESMAMLMRLRGHEAFLAHDGLEAVEAAERVEPDAILLDIGLPTLNGYEVCRRIREKPSGKDIVLVAVTGWGQQEDRNRSKEAGFDTHIVKPVDHDALIALLNTLIPENQNRRQAAGEDLSSVA
jgi:PAS domain S-box-containing protein